ncbi:MAG: hypothetical protein V1743_03305 [Nanoarchaeota archaeon]
MGKQKYQERIAELFAKSPVVEFASLQRIIGSAPYAKLSVSVALRQGKIKRLARGIYTIHDDISLSVYAFRPGYLGLQSALSYHRIWEQETVPVIITSRTTRLGTREIMGGNVHVHRISKKYLFGYTLYRDGQLYFPYSDVEKTIIDVVWFRQALDADAIKKAKRMMDTARLKKYLEAYPLSFRKKVQRLIG